MRILLINHFPLQGSGSGVYVANIAKSLEKKGHETCIITPENTSDLINLENVKLHPVYFKYEEKIDGQQDFNFPCFDPHPRSHLLFNDMTIEQIEQYKDAFRNAIKEEIEEFKPDIIHAQHLWLISDVAEGFNIPVVITSHGSDIMGYDMWPKFHEMMYRTAKNCKNIIAISNDSNRKIANIFKDEKEKIITILNGYDEKIFYIDDYDKKEVLEKLGINKEYKKIVCFAGRLTDNKGIDVLLKAAKIYEKSDDILTIIAGDGEDYQKLFELKEKLELKNVYFVGNKQHDVLREIYNISDVCAVPSRQEAFGLVALEAIACGTPVVATNQGGIPDFINESVGTLINVDSIEELAASIEEILDETKSFDRKALASYAKDNYKQDLLIDKLIQVYKKGICNE